MTTQGCLAPGKSPGIFFRTSRHLATVVHQRTDSRLEGKDCFLEEDNPIDTYPIETQINARDLGELSSLWNHRRKVEMNR